MTSLGAILMGLFVLPVLVSLCLPDPRGGVPWYQASREPTGLVWTAAGAIGKMHELSPRHMMQLSVSPRRSAVTP